MVLRSAAAAAAMMKLACPHCGEAQARARKPKGSIYACTKCRRRFTREEGQARAARSR